MKHTKLTIAIVFAMIAFYAKAQWAFNVNHIYNTNVGNVGVGTSNPKSKLHVLGPGLWDLSTSEGDFKIGNDSYRLKMGVALAGAGAGDCYIAAHGTTGNTLYLGTANSSANLSTVSIRSGRVGIAVANRTERFAVLSFDNSDATNIASILANNRTQGVGIGFNAVRSIGTNADVNLNFVTKGNGYFTFNAKNADRVRIQPNADVEIGIDDLNNGTPTNGALRFGASSGEAIASKRTAGGNQYGLDFYTGFANRMSITSGGNVGIGTTAPEGNLHIFRGSAGAVTADGNALLVIENNNNNYINLLTPAANERGILFGDNLHPQDGGIVYVGANNMQFRTNGNVARMGLTDVGDLELYGANNGANTLGALRFGAGSGEAIASKRTTGGNQYGLDFYTSFVSRMSITNSGNVGIGVASPAYKLEVCGTIRAKEVRVETGWCDYVFEKGYNLKSIDELEKYINENKHLPGIAPASEVEKEGLKVAEMNKAMMEKIEELTLYVIDQNKQIQHLQQKIGQLEKNDADKKN